MSKLNDYILKVKNYWKDHSDFTENDIIRYVYIDLGKRFSFDLNYVFGNSTQKRKIYRGSANEKSIENLVDNNVGICVSMAYVVEKILMELGINACTMRDPYDDRKLAHVYNVVTPTEGDPYIIDLQEDLENIQSHSRTIYFGLDQDNGKNYIISLQKQKEMDEKIGFIDSKNPYTDEYIYFLKSNLGLFERFDDKVKFALENLEIYQNPNIDYAERKWKHEQFLNRLFTSKELGKIHQLDCYNLDGNGNKEYKLYVAVDSR